MYYIFHGEDTFSAGEELQKLRQRMGDPQFADLNTTVLDGKRLSVGELRHNCDAIPFLSDKRLVIVTNMLVRLEPTRKGTDEAVETEVDSEPELKDQLVAYLPKLPETTRLVFLESKSLSKSNPILKMASKDKKNAHVKHFPSPEPPELPSWVIDHAKQKGVNIEYPAASELALAVGDDLRALDNELEKLVAYRAGATIRREDVLELVPYERQEQIFDLVDALGHRNSRRAVELLHNQLEHGEDPLRLMGMIARQYRLLLQICDLRARGLSPDQIRQQLGLHPFAARKLAEQSHNYSLGQLESIMGMLLDTDIALKTGRLEPVTALDLLLIELTRV